QLGQKCDVLTYELENISAQQIKLLCEKYNIPKGYQAIQLLQERLTEKETLKSVGTKVVTFISVKETTDIEKAIETLG
ncbi:phosphoribosylaminoimidazole carboxylase, partial [Staphylococcus aureus]